MPVTLFWDASALAKHYVPEKGSDTVRVLFASAPAPRMMTTLWGYTETHSIICRKRNDKRISEAVFRFSLAALRQEALSASQFTLLPVEEDDILSSTFLIERYSLNATDAALLATWQRYLLTLEPAARAQSVLVTADRRFLNAARAEGLSALSPDETTTADVPAFLADL